jgi:ABC-type antimicrobial peptide transport system permease subunit
MPYRQVDSWLPAQIAVRTTLPAPATIDLLKSVTRAVDPNQPVANPRTGADQLWRSMGRRRFQLTLFGALAGIATILAVVGVYGVLSFMLTEERRDLGVRAALGATPGQLQRSWLRRGLVLIGLGISAGAALSWWTGRLMQGFLFGIEPTDAAAHLAGLAIVVVTAVAACWIPARRAAAVDPIAALRGD